MELAWEEGLSVGNAMIDSDHKHLLVVINNVEHAIRAKDSIGLSREFKLLEELMRIHFTNEEKIAQAVNFPFTNNKLEHYYMLKVLQQIGDELDAKNGILSEEATEHFSNFLNDFITEHIRKEDMLMKPVLQTYPYNFKPD